MTYCKCSSLLQPNFDEKASDSSETEDSYTDWQEPLSDSGPETEDNDNWEETRATESCVNAVKYVETTVGDVECNTVPKKILQLFSLW